MTTVDNLIKSIVNHNPELLDREMKSQDLKALRNLTRLVDDPKYITENQSKLIIRLLKDNITCFKDFEAEINQIVSAPTWARNFRVLQQLRKLYVGKDLEIPQIVIEYSFSSDLHRIILGLFKSVDGLYAVTNGKIYGAPLTEKNIVELVDKLKVFKFSISEELTDYYNTIKSWSKNDILDQYRITTISYPNFEKQIIADLGIDTAINNNIINDRSIRYQYFPENPEKNPKNLVEILANRTATKVWIDNSVFPLSNLIKSFIELKRLPTLVVLDTRDDKKCLKNLKFLSDSLEENGIFEGVGVYFRLDNHTDGKDFNQYIAEKKYNSQLDANTKIVVVQSGKIPKFLLKSAWKPMSVVSIDHPLRHSKTAVYSNCCDLIVTYTDTQPIIESRFPWE